MQSSPKMKRRRTRNLHTCQRKRLTNVITGKMLRYFRRNPRWNIYHLSARFSKMLQNREELNDPQTVTINEARFSVPIGEVVTRQDELLYCTLLYCTVLYCTVLYWSPGRMSSGLTPSPGASAPSSPRGRARWCSRSSWTWCLCSVKMPQLK